MLSEGESNAESVQARSLKDGRLVSARSTDKDVGGATQGK
jgi:hypothetical protein